MCVYLSYYFYLYLMVKYYTQEQENLPWQLGADLALKATGHGLSILFGHKWPHRTPALEKATLWHWGNDTQKKTTSWFCLSTLPDTRTHPLPHVTWSWNASLHVKSLASCRYSLLLVEIKICIHRVTPAFCHPLLWSKLLLPSTFPKSSDQSTNMIINPL